MTASKDIRKYTEEWLKLFNRFNDNPREDYVVPCNTIKEAEKVRLDWYKARAALQQEEAQLSPEVYAEFGHPNLNRKECLIVGTDVHFVFKESSGVAHLLKESFKYNDRDTTQPMPAPSGRRKNDVEAKK